MSERRSFHRPDDPGAAWAYEVLAPLRGRRADIDIAPEVMRRIATLSARPVHSHLPVAWQQLGWAASLFLGFATLALLVATAGAMIVGGDEGAREAIALFATAARTTLRSFDAMAGIMTAFAGAALAILKGVWVMVDALAPLVRGGAFAGAIAGVASIGISIVIISRARHAAPVSDRPGTLVNHGGLS